MKILALEFSPPQRSVAVWDGRVLAEVLETQSRHTDGVGMMERALRLAGLEREQIECVAVGLGPGSYHGIRAAIGLAQGWQLANGVRLLGVSSAAILAAEASAQGLTGTLGVVIDAQRSEFYWARFQIDDRGHQEVEPLRIATHSEVLANEASGAVLIGPEVTRWFASGRTLFPRASTLAALAAARNDFVAGEKLEPIYLRETAFVKAPPLRVIASP